MDNMEMSDIMKEEATLPAEEWPVDCSSRAALEVPFLSTVMGHDWVSVVQVGNHDD